MAGLSNRACSVGFASCETLGKHYHASLRLRSFGSLHLCIDSHLCRCICASTAICAVASVHRQPFVPLHLCNDSHLCRCIVQRLCVAVFMHPCITTLCGCLYASLHNDFVRPPSCILCTFMNALWALRPCKAFGRSFYKASVPLRSFGSARPCADSVRPLSCIHARPASCGFSHPPTHKKCNPTH